MPQADYDAVIRDRAYAIWQKAGCPSGREHEHWAEARREVEAEARSAETAQAQERPRDTHRPESGLQETIRLRQALYEPEPFSFDLFGSECPRIDRAIVLRDPHAPRMRVERRSAA